MPTDERCPHGAPIYACSDPTDRAAQAHADHALYRTKPAVAQLADALWECYAASGADTDGDAGPGAMIGGMGLQGFATAVVEAVKELRNDYQEALDESA